jgi:hypothetical protein
MQRKSLDDLGELQRTVLETVWDLREANVHQVRERLGKRKKLAYTTVLSAMQKLEIAPRARPTFTSRQPAGSKAEPVPFAACSNASSRATRWPCSSI